MMPQLGTEGFSQHASNLLSGDWEQSGLDQQRKQYYGPAIAVRHMHLVQPSLQRYSVCSNLQVKVVPAADIIGLPLLCCLISCIRRRCSPRRKTSLVVNVGPHSKPPRGPELRRDPYPA